MVVTRWGLGRGPPWCGVLALQYSDTRVGLPPPRGRPHGWGDAISAGYRGFQETTGIALFGAKDCGHQPHTWENPSSGPDEGHWAHTYADWMEHCGRFRYHVRRGALAARP